ncbi:hypothetical protein TNCV_4457731 [Trichonephila clavipes]|nr:hypothetical protein TNCV_4457731 [Trichonephila clavipes]
MNRTFSIRERSGERAGQGNSQTFSVSRKIRTIPATCGRALSAAETFVIDNTIEFVPVCDLASMVAAAIVPQLIVHAVANVVELFVQTLVVLQKTLVLDSGLATWLHNPLRPCG